MRFTPQARRTPTTTDDTSTVRILGVQRTARHVARRSSSAFDENRGCTPSSNEAWAGGGFIHLAAPRRVGEPAAIPERAPASLADAAESRPERMEGSIILGARAGRPPASARGERSRRRRPQRFQRLAQHLPALPERSLRHRREQPALAWKRFFAWAQLDDARGHFGGGVKAAGETSNRIRVSQRQLQRRQAAHKRALRGRRDDALGDLALEHQRQPVEPGWPDVPLQPAVSRAVAIL